ncbi:MAG: hypothetical protein IPL81_04980 [Flavobacteriales bacterium]|nr:hypothetical protein [Flavobacteriales bacterium]MBK9059236.1 hypothetical protein [Flavobacteriales bacterium]QQS73793.1 MAG: hypothetical protein IPP95_06115 [Flavobacteriales bacterium]HQV40364.1 hypothetical protein [Flavobacteriales bacterium]HQW33768.1 hypothetical protein [Flavobacteriales bacterium]
MSKHSVKILDTAFITHNVKRFKVERPEGYSFTPGQAAMLALKKEACEVLPIYWTGFRRLLV